MPALYKIRIVVAAVTSGLFVADFVIARATGGQIDAGVTAGWLLSLGWVFGGGVRDAIKRNGKGDDAS